VKKVRIYLVDFENKNEKVKGECERIEKECELLIYIYIYHKKSF
jgi:hypothetical protein